MNKATRNEIIDTSFKESVLESCRNYIGSRHSSYEFRSIRYEAVLDTLKLLGFTDTASIIDVGGADGEFGKYLIENGFKGKYQVIDGMIDGTDLNNWSPKGEDFDFAVSIEVIEHLKVPSDFLKSLDNVAKKGIVVTTPNPLVVDVKAMDKTHISPTYPKDFYANGYKCYPQCLFFENGDTLLGVKGKIQGLTNY